MKKLMIILLLFMCFVSIGIHAQTQPTDTDGDGYYNISTLDHLRWVSENSQSWKWNFELDNDIDASDTKNWNNGSGWYPIGNASTKFRGIFDGHGYNIINLYINRPVSRSVGFFGYIYKAKISNIGISNCNITGKNYVGGLCGYNFLAGIIDNSYSTGSAIGGDFVGGLCGENRGSINNSYSAGSVIGFGDYIGGLCGVNNDGSISNSYTNTSTTKGKKGVGGLCGYNRDGSIINSSANGWVTGTNEVGGLCGGNYGSSISNSYSRGSVTGTWNIGGLCGSNVGSIINSYASISVAGFSRVGGLCGYNGGGRISNSYSIGHVSGHSNIGGFLGRDYEYKGIFSGNFWDIQTSGIDSSVAGKGKTTIEMKTKSTFTNAGWDFTEIWDINPDVNNGYPFLREVFSSVEEDDVLTDDLFIYPNPTYNFITIANHLAPNCRVYDINGRLVLEFQSNTADVSGLPKGIYFVIIRDKGKSYYQRFIKD